MRVKLLVRFLVEAAVGLGGVRYETGLRLEMDLLRVDGRIKVQCLMWVSCFTAYCLFAACSTPSPPGRCSRRE